MNKNGWQFHAGWKRCR